MIEINNTTAAKYLQSTGRGAAAEFQVRELAGGVSNVVLLVTPAGGKPFVLKQARGRLRVKDEWLCPVERIWREVDVLRICASVIGMRTAECGMRNGMQIVVPQVLWEDRANYVYAMSAAPEGHRTWKELLLAGELTDAETIAEACGRLLAALHEGTWQDAAIADQLADRSFFDQLRLDPYYRQIARVHPELAPQIGNVLDSVWQHRRCLVHGDFSPKNLLVSAGQLMLIDFEVGHFGDPAFDLGFFLTHLVLKAIWAGPRGNEYSQLADRFWTTYSGTLRPSIGDGELADLARRMLANVAACVLARVDGKSPVDYLTHPQQSAVRRLAAGWLMQPPADWNALRESLA